MTIQEYVAGQTERVAESLCHFIATTPEDKLRWRPELEGSAGTRSALEQIGECVTVNSYMAKLMRGEEVNLPAGGWPDVPFENGQDAQEKLRQSASNLAAAIRALSEADLARAYQHPRGSVPGENLILMPYRNMAYHAGQINLLQMLYGDAEFHLPPNWR